MPRIFKRFVASKATIHADSFDRPRKIRQTGAHHAFGTMARGNVKIVVDKQYPNKGGNEERPPSGTVIKGDSAEVSSRRIFGIHPSKIFKGQKSKVAEDNVQAIVYKDEDEKPYRGKKK